MHIVKALPFIAVLAICSRAANTQEDDYWDAEKDWTSHFGPCSFFRLFNCVLSIFFENAWIKAK